MFVKYLTEISKPYKGKIYAILKIRVKIRFNSKELLGIESYFLDMK